MARAGGGTKPLQRGAQLTTVMHGSAGDGVAGDGVELADGSDESVQRREEVGVRDGLRFVFDERGLWVHDAISKGDVIVVTHGVGELAMRLQDIVQAVGFAADEQGLLRHGPGPDVMLLRPFRDGGVDDWRDATVC